MKCDLTYLISGGVDILTAPVFYRLFFSADVVILFENLDAG